MTKPASPEAAQAQRLHGALAWRLVAARRVEGSIGEHPRAPDLTCCEVSVVSTGTTAAFAAAGTQPWFSVSQPITLM